MGFDKLLTSSARYPGRPTKRDNPLGSGVNSIPAQNFHLSLSPTPTIGKLRVSESRSVNMIETYLHREIWPLR